MTNHRRLLIIDDMPIFSAYVRDVAEEIGFETCVARHAGEFKDLYRTFDPGVISLDMIMPWGNGFQLLNWLCGVRSEARVLIISGYSVAYAEAAKQLAAIWGLPEVETFTKPISLGQLRAALVSGPH